MSSTKPVNAAVDPHDNAACEDLRAYMNVVLQHHVSPDAWRWEYYHDAGKVVLTKLKDGNGKTVGSQTFLPIELIVDNQPVWTVKSENSFIDASQRGGTVFKDLYAYGANICRERGIQMIWGFTQVVKAWRDKLGFAVYEDWVHEAHLRLSPSTLSEYRRTHGLLKSIAISIYHSLLSISNRSRIRSLRVKLPAGYSWQSTFNNDDVNSLLDRVLPDSAQQIRLDMNKSYFNWRVTQNPNLPYRSVFLYNSKNELEGYYIYSISDSMAHLAEAVYTPETRSYVISRLLESVTKDGVNGINYFANIHHPWCQATIQMLTRLGGKVLPNKDMNFVLRVEDPSKASVVDRKNDWYLNSLWTEGYKM